MRVLGFVDSSLSQYGTTGSIVIFLTIDAYLLAAAIIAQFGPATRQKRLDEVSP